ncbi:adenylate kinase [Campylobacter lari]|uniref:adenylate kinase n=1 Tax=Campylobacter lari TaxID=201 RepID=UPI0012C33587|nr:adenylate kinase [Campylobacter lari]EAI7247520.1 adenylate kinase [Campylobacter lari]EAJ1270002.1 adenylate kinase [Campylobacter lari]EAJ6135961.1 adenylate kinase [Campylobacter lari]EGK7475415.1 adenylate kinase [Campylobacter lari]EGK8087092.1 adenylate kinase [Campylobacter lari]
MIFLIGGESHTGKTLLAQKLLEKYSYSYLSLDHLKMGLIKGMKDCPFKVYEDEKISEYLFPIIESIIQTCLENSQNLIIEGIYLTPKRVQKFKNNSLIKIFYIIFSKEYILQNYKLIYQKENIIETRLTSEKENMNILISNHQYLKSQCENFNLPFLEIKKDYEIEIQKAFEFFV